MRSVGDGSDLGMPAIADVIGRAELGAEIAGFVHAAAGRRIMVTGAGGSIGSEICRMLAPLRPSELLLLDRDESALEAAQRSLIPDTRPALVELSLCDIREADRLRRIFETHRPEIVFHAAALKHVPLLQHHPEKALLTNVLATANVLDAAEATKASVLVNLSTDKAADPINVLGFSKLLSERLTAWYGRRPGRTRFLSVRLGNVLGSRGSMWDVFHEQIARGGPLTMTDDTATRYFITPAEAVRLMFGACVAGRNGETLVQDFGRPVLLRDAIGRIVDHFGGRYEVVQTGLRPGEKLHEVMVGVGETVVRRPANTPFSAVRVPPLDPATVRARYATTSGRVTAEWLAALSRSGLPPTEPGGNEFATDVGAPPMRDKFGFPLKWALNFRRSGHAVERLVTGWEPTRAAGIRAATLLLDERDDDALRLLDGLPLTHFRDVFNAGIANERMGRKMRAAALLSQAQAMDPERFGKLRAEPHLRRATVVLPFPVSTGGGLAVQANLARLLADFGFDVTVLQMREPHGTADGVHPFPGTVRHITGQRELTAELKRRPPSLTIVGSWLDYLAVLEAGAGPVLGYSGGEPTLNETDGFDDRFVAQRRQAHRLPVRLFTCSRFIQSMYYDLFERSASYVPAALDARAFQPAGPPRRRPLRALVMAWDGLKDKGLHYALPALRNLADRGLGIEIVWISPQPPSVFTDIECELYVDPPKDLLFDVLRSCHVLVYPPLIDGLGLPPLEAMAAGVAVVITASGGSGEFIEPGRNCLQVPKASVPEIERAVETLYHDESLRGRLIAEGRRVAQRYRPANASAEFHQFLHRNTSPVCTDLT